MTNTVSAIGATSVGCGIIARMTTLRAIGLVLGVIVPGGLVPPARGELEFGQRFVEIKATPEQTQAVAEYAFTNTGREPVRIASVDTACSCTTAKPDKEVYAPGESGKLTVLFEFESRLGAQDKNITVTTDAGQKVQLRLLVHIPELLTITPRMVYWRKNEAATPKTINIEISQDVKMKITSVDVSGGSAKAELRTVEEGRRYQVIVTPGDASGTTTILLRTNFPPESPRFFTAYAKKL